MKDAYLELISLVERLHRQCLEVVKADLDRRGIRDLNNVQALILFNIGEEEFSVGELTQRGYYLGSNVSYNVKKLVENGYLEQERSPHDRRSVRVRLSAKALELCGRINALHDRHVKAMLADVMDAGELEGVNNSLRAIERFWADQLRYGP